VYIYFVKIKPILIKQQLLYFQFSISFLPSVLLVQKSYYFTAHFGPEQISPSALRAIRQTISRVAVDNLKDGLMQEETNSILYQRT
jgi:hypothetical protein